MQAQLEDHAPTALYTLLTKFLFKILDTRLHKITPGCGHLVNSMPGAVILNDAHDMTCSALPQNDTVPRESCCYFASNDWCCTFEAISCTGPQRVIVHFAHDACPSLLSFTAPSKSLTICTIPIPSPFGHLTTSSLPLLTYPHFSYNATPLNVAPISSLAKPPIKPVFPSRAAASQYRIIIVPRPWRA